MPVSEIKIPADIKPVDGRFGCGPSKIRPAALGTRCKWHENFGNLAPTKTSQERC